MHHSLWFLVITLTLSTQFLETHTCPKTIKDTYVSIKTKIQRTYQKIKKVTTSDKPKYIGCYKDKEDNRDIQFIGARSPEMKIEKCDKICKDQYPMTKYFGLQNGNLCFCSNDYGNYGVERDGHCDKPCAGAKDEMCGGELLNSVYEKA